MRTCFVWNIQIINCDKFFLIPELFLLKNRDTRFERAVTMDEGDYNGDGKPDLLIGNSFFDFGPFGYNIAEPLFYVLKNVAR